MAEHTSRADGNGAHTTTPRPKEPSMNPLTVAILASPLLATLTAIGYRRATRSWRRWAR